MAKTLTFRDPRTPPARLSPDAAYAWRDFFRLRPGWRGDRAALTRYCRTFAKSMELYREFETLSLQSRDVFRLMKSKRGLEKATLWADWLELGHRQLKNTERSVRASQSILRFLRKHPKPRA